MLHSYLGVILFLSGGSGVVGSKSEKLSGLSPTRHSSQCKLLKGLHITAACWTHLVKHKPVGDTENIMFTGE